jgi:hypothetical protein
VLTLEEAQDKMARLMLEERDEHHKLYAEPLKGGGFIYSGSAGEGKDDRPHKAAKHAVKLFGDELAGMPQFRDELICWMVDVTGEGEPSDESKREALRTLNFARLTGKAGGNLASTIREWIADKLYMQITDSGGGCGGWHMGVPCNEEQSRTLCKSLHSEFARAIDSGLIKVLCRFWGWRLPGLYNWDDAEKYARARGWEAP